MQLPRNRFKHAIAAGRQVSVIGRAMAGERRMTMSATTPTSPTGKAGTSSTFTS